jgi:phosphate acyltransferase
MRLAVDVMGGDRGPEELLEGIKLALADDKDVETLWVVGLESEISKAIEHIALRDPRIRIHAASEVLSMDDDPGLAVRRKKDSSLMRALGLVREGEADAVISSGNTGALVAGATVRLGRLDGVKRPALACVMPTKTAAFVLLDGGANPDCPPEVLVQFAVMGSEYARAMLGIENPRIGVISNGSELHKGTDLTRAAVQMLQKTHLNCVGYCEGHDLFAGEVDVAVCDGFVGNIVLKTSEGLGKVVGGLLKEELGAGILRKLGALLAMNGLRKVRSRMNPDTYGGAPLLGLSGNAFKIHGGANRHALHAAIRQSARAVRTQLNAAIIRGIARTTESLAHAPAHAEA